VSLGVLPAVARDLVLAGALISILATPFLFVAADWIYAHHEPPKKPEAAPEPEQAVPEIPTREPIPVTHLTDHVVLVGYGRVGSVVGAELKAANVPLFVIESDEDIVESLRATASRRSSATPPIRSSREPRTIRRHAACWSRSRTASRADRWSSRRAP
jgi:CPA2 family monovalent cation:H+ antiporter-2